MSRIPDKLHATIAANIRACRKEKFPGRGGGKKCAEAFGVHASQWSMWENKRTPNETRLQEIADFFGTTVSFLRENGDGHGSALSVGKNVYTLTFDFSDRDSPYFPAIAAMNILEGVSDLAMELFPGKAPHLQRGMIYSFLAGAFSAKANKEAGE